MCTFFCTLTNLHTCICKYFYTVQQILNDNLQKLLFFIILFFRLLLASPFLVNILKNNVVSDKCTRGLPDHQHVKCRGRRVVENLYRRL